MSVIVSVDVSQSYDWTDICQPLGEGERPVLLWCLAVSADASGSSNHTCRRTLFKSQNNMLLMAKLVIFWVQHQWNALQHKWIIHPATQCMRGLTTVTVYSDGVVRTISVWWKLMSFIACFYISSQQESFKFEIWSLTSNLSPGSLSTRSQPFLDNNTTQRWALGQCSTWWLTDWLLLRNALLWVWVTLLRSFRHRTLAGCLLPSGTRRVVSSILAILAPSHNIFYCYDIPRYIVTLSILVSSRKYRR